MDFTVRMKKAGDLLSEDHRAAGDADLSNKTPAFSRIDQQVPISTSGRQSQRVSRRRARYFVFEVAIRSSSILVALHQVYNISSKSPTQF